MARAFVFAVKNNVTNEPIFVRRNETGFYALDPRDHETWAALYNAQPPKVTESAMAASMFGWDVPAAREALEYSGAPAVLVVIPS